VHVFNVVQSGLARSAVAAGQQTSVFQVVLIFEKCLRRLCEARQPNTSLRRLLRRHGIVAINHRTGNRQWPASPRVVPALQYFPALLKSRNQLMKRIPLNAGWLIVILVTCSQ